MITYSMFLSLFFRNGLPSNNDSPFQPFKAASNPLPPPPPPPSSVANTPVHPLLGLPSPFPFLASGLSGLTDPKAKGHLPPGLPPGFPNMMDMHSTQALLNLARSGNFLGQPPVTSAPSHNSSAFSPSLSSEASKKRPLAPSEALDLSPPTSVNKKAKIEVRNLPLNNQTTTSPVASAADPTILNWSVSEVSNFVSSIDICRDYAEVSKLCVSFFCFYHFIFERGTKFNQANHGNEISYTLEMIMYEVIM